MTELIERRLWRKHTRRDIWIEYRATFEDEKLVGLRNATYGYEIPLDTRTARMIEKRHERFRIVPPVPADIEPPPSAQRRYMMRHKTARYTSA